MAKTPAETLFQGNYLTLKKIDNWEYAAREHPVVVVLVAWTAEGKLLLVEQYRPPIGRRAIELPAGLVGDVAGQEDESVELAAARELEEETGYRAGVLEICMRCPTSAGMSNEEAVFLLASGLTRVGPGGGDASEQITVHEVDAAHVDDWLDRRREEGLAIDPKIYTALYLSGRFRP